MKKSLLIGLVLLAVPFFVNAGDIDDLKSAYRTYTQAVMKGDVDEILSLVSDEFVQGTSTSPVPIAKNKEEKKAELMQVYAGMESLHIMSHSPNFYVVNDTGVVFGHRYVRGEWDFREVGYDERFVLSFSKQDGKWILVGEVGDPIKHSLKTPKY